MVWFTLAMAVLGGLTLGCSEEADLSTKQRQGFGLLNGVAEKRSRLESQPTAQVVTSLLKESLEVDMVLLPVSYFADEAGLILEEEISNAADVERVLFPLLSAEALNPSAELVLGTMRGRDIKDLIKFQTLHAESIDLEVAGLRYALDLQGGWVRRFDVQRASLQGERLPFDEDAWYRVALSEAETFRRFPGYRFRHGLNRSLKTQKSRINLVDTLRSLPQQDRLRPKGQPNLVLASLGWEFASIRSRLRHVGGDTAPLAWSAYAERSISAVQGSGFLSPQLGTLVRTRGVVTGVPVNPKGAFAGAVFIQSLTPDNDPRTSEGLRLQCMSEHRWINHAGDDVQNCLDRFEGLSVGDLIEVRGEVWEKPDRSGLSTTTLRVQGLRVIETGAVQPAPVQLGGAFANRALPTRRVSTSTLADLNVKKELELSDGIDFYESLEGMRVRLARPTLVGFDGGMKKWKKRFRPDRYLHLYVLPAALQDSVKQRTQVGGLRLGRGNDESGRFQVDENPEVVRLTLSALSTQNELLSTDMRVGMQSTSDILGLMTFETGTFGAGEYHLLFQSPVEFGEAPSREVTPLRERERVSFVPQKHRLTVAAYNVENLSIADDRGKRPRDKRIPAVVESIAYNLRCPDIIQLVEVQDDTGSDFAGGASSEQTLAAIAEELDKQCRSEYGQRFDQGFVYRTVHVDPVLHAEGGKPGTNIRVALAYNSKRVEFKPYGKITSDRPVRIDAEGRLSTNPGRLLVGRPEFRGVRGSLVTELEFMGEQVLLVGNHWNSKIADGSPWAAKPIWAKPPATQAKRVKLARQIRQAVLRVLKGRPDVKLIVLGDFNDFEESPALRLLAGGSDDPMLPAKAFDPLRLANLARIRPQSGESLVSWAERYSYIRLGSAQSLDSVFVSKALLDQKPQLEFVHVNTHYMGQVADHDPVIASFSFAE